MARLSRIRRMMALGGVLLLTLIILSQVWAAVPPAAWTTGHKKILIIPVRFTDQVGPSDAPGPSGVLSGWGNITNGSMTAEMTNFFVRQSYGKCTIDFTLLPEINLGVSHTVYTNVLNADNNLTKYTRWYEAGSFADDVRARARQVGITNGTPDLYDTDNYDLDIIATGFITNQNVNATALTYGKGVYANLFTALPHELCHNLGLSHAWGYSRSTFYAPLVKTAYFENKYGNVYDLMGNKETHVLPLPADRDAGVYWKYTLGWLPVEHIITSPPSGTYRIYAFDQGTLDAGKYYAMRITRDPFYTYWFSYRQAITGADAMWATNGLEVNFGAETYQTSSGNTFMLDMTPGSRGLAGAAFATIHDAQLAIGRTYSDLEANLHITPIKKGGTTPESLDVVINYGPFPTNLAPTVSIAPLNVTLGAGVPQSFTSTASDPNGDTLAYYWEFEDSAKPGGVEVGGINTDSQFSTQGSHTWTRNGEYFVRCTVSDMKGRTFTVSSKVTVTNGIPGLLTISGLVKDENGDPLMGAIVNNYKGTAPAVTYDSTNFAASGETAADGKYIVQLPLSGAQTNNLSVMYRGHAFTCSVANASIVLTNTSVTNVNFTRVRTNRTISGGIYVAGRSYDPATDGPLIINVSGQPTNAGFGSWQMTVPDGTLINLTATPSNGAYTVFNYSPNPYVAVSDYNLLHLFVNIPGKMPETGFTTNGATSDDTVGTVNIPVTMTLPAGSNSWVQEEAFDYWIDSSSTAEYGVDYKMSGGHIAFPGGKTPVARIIPLKIIPNGVPKTKTVVIKLGVSSSVANLGPFTTFTYTITNPFRITGVSRTNNMLNLTWQSTTSARYTIESTPSLNPASWSSLPPHTNLTGLAGSTTRSIDLGISSNAFYRVKVE